MSNGNKSLGLAMAGLAMQDALYGDETVRPLEEKRRELLQQLKVLDMEMLKHLRDIVAMLKLGREIMESKIDEKWCIRHTEYTSRIQRGETGRGYWSDGAIIAEGHCSV